MRLVSCPSKYMFSAVRSVRVRVCEGMLLISCFLPPFHLALLLGPLSAPSSVIPLLSMSKRFKRVAKTEKTVLAHLTQDSGLKLLSEVPNERRPYASRDAGLLVGPQGLVYGPSGVFSHVGPAAPVRQANLLGTSSVGSAVAENNDNNEYVDEQRVAKNQRLWNRWEKEVLPSMVKPFMELLHTTSSLRDLGMVRWSGGCAGCISGRVLGVFCIFVDSEFSAFGL